MRLLITGASGLYGSKLAQLAVAKHYEVYSAHSRHQAPYGTPIELDVTDKEKVESAFRKTRPEVVVHAASMTDVDKCELNKELAWKVNVEGTENIARAAKASRAFLLYISTDYVFNGEKGCYLETDAPSPINYYGVTKLKAEENVATIVDEHCIARPSVIYGSKPCAGKTNFALWLLSKLKNNEPVRIVTDQWNSPTLNASLAEMTLEIVERKLSGIYHISGATRISRFDFAKQLAKVFSLNQGIVTPISYAEFHQSATRPQDSSLDTAKAQQTLENKPLQINQALERLKKDSNEF